MALLSSSSSSSSSHTWVYDVFPSFSGEDVRVTFLSHFLKELDRKLIIAFKDNEIERSRSLDPELKQAIKDSRIAVVVFSKNYASSSWCLNELLGIVKCKEECGQMVIPVFYCLDPSHVRKQTGDFGKIFEETCHNKTEELKTQWSEALTNVANILGYHSVTWGNEAKMIEEIANDVLDKLFLTPWKDSEDFVGIQDHIANMSELLQLESVEVRMVGLWGSLGIGKTTIARALFNRLFRHFQGRIFIDRAFVSKSKKFFGRANPDDYNMKLHLQRKFLSKILGKKDIHLDRLGAVGERLKHQKVLIFIDDLDDQVVLDALVGETQWFGNGSRIVVVTNDKQFLRAHGIAHIYEVCLPSEYLAQEMLCRSAFKKISPPEGFENRVVEVARLAGSLPLGLSVLGSYLRGRDKEYWVDLLPRLQNGLDGKIEKTLRVSYDGLSSEGDKAIFRHIACLFNGAKVTNIKLLLADSGLGVNIGLINLADKSLIDVRYGDVWMHRLLQEMGRSIVRLDEPEKREFLVDSQDICVLNEGTGTQKILGISLDIDELHLHESSFKGMRNLRFLKISSKKLQLPENFDYFPPELKSFCWPEFPMRCMPSKFRPENLVILKMKNSKLEKLWEGVVTLTCLKKMNLSESHNLKEIPDLSKAINLETLKLGFCYSLVELPSSISHLNKLTTLNLIHCRNLEIIPIGISLKSLDFLILNGCSMVQPLTPLMSPSLVNLWLSDISSLVELPSSFQNLHTLKILKIKNCVNLETLPTGINLQSLYNLDLSGCSRLRTFPDISANISYLYLEKTAIEEVPWWIEKFSRLNWLLMNGCNKLEYVNLNISKLEHLWKVDFSDCKALTGARWNGSPRRVDFDFTNCSSLDQEALFQQKTYFNCQLRLSGEEVPSYFTHRTTGTYSSLTIPLLPSSLSQPFFRFRACIVFDPPPLIAQFHLKGRFWNSFDSFGQPRDFWERTEIWACSEIFTINKDSYLRILDCRIPLSKDSAEMNFNHVDLQFHITICDSLPQHEVKEWGIRVIEDCSSAKNRLGDPNTLPHVLEADMLNEAVEQVEECGGKYVVTETSCKRMRIS